MSRLPRPKNFTPVGQRLTPRPANVPSKPPRTALQATAKSLVNKFDKLDAPTRQEKLKELKQTDPELHAMVVEYARTIIAAREAAASGVVQVGGVPATDVDHSEAIQQAFSSRAPRRA